MPRLSPFALLLVITAPANAQSDADTDPPPAFERRVEIAEDEGRADLARFAETWTTRDEWLARATLIRAHILKAMNLDPLPQRTPLSPIRHSRREHDGYSVENVAFESIPGFFVTGNLYLPANHDGPVPAVLCPHGHFQPHDADPGGRFRADMQIRCATLARMGAAAFAYDMVGWGESTQVTHDHADSLTLQTLNSIRAIDFLISLEEVDPSRIAVTGASGGGTQSFLLAALDDRIAASVPVVMVAAHFFGGCLCESGLPIHRSALHETNNAEIAALAAPRAQLIISCGKDWTKNTPDVEFPYIHSVYEVLQSADRIANVHLAEEGHDYGPSKRAAMYRFLAKHFRLDLAAVTNLDGSIDETGITIEPRDDLCVFDEDHPRPESALTTREAVHAALAANE